jgi:hypothetical protein
METGGARAKDDFVGRIANIVYMLRTTRFLGKNIPRHKKGRGWHGGPFVIDPSGANRAGQKASNQRAHVAR